MNAEKCQGYSFHSFWDIKGKPAGEKGWGGVGKTNPHPDQGLDHNGRTKTTYNSTQSSHTE